MESAPQDFSFLDINYVLSDKGFFVTSTDAAITWARTGAIYWLPSGLLVARSK